nr:cyclodeaminase/cyclohydrolase family protein [uncultured Microbacterium sp.]
MKDDADIPVSTPLDAWLAELGQATGAPGGGAAAGVMLSMGASLLRMVAEYTPDDARAAESARRLEGIRLDALDAAEADGIVSNDFGAALALSHDDPGRDGRVRDAAVEASESSVRLGSVGIRVVDEVQILAEIGNHSVRADLAVGSQALTGGLFGAWVNLRSNLRFARRYGASGDVLAELEMQSERLANARQRMAQIVDGFASEFDG